MRHIIYLNRPYHWLQTIRRNSLIITRNVIYLVCLFMMTSCATLKPQVPVVEKQSDQPIKKIAWAERETILSKLNNWDLNGKIAVQTAHDAGSATVSWSQRNQQYIITLLGPLGTHGMRLSGGDHHVTLVTANGQQFSARTPEELLGKQWGYHLPVSYLRYWIRGLPAPGRPYTHQLDQYNRLSSLRQAGFQILFQDYQSNARVALPTRLSIASSSLKTKMIIYSWRVK